MGLVELEKKGTVHIDGMSTDEQVAHIGTLGDENLGSLNMAPTNYEFKQTSPIVDHGMSYGHIKKEASVLSTCLSTVLMILLIFGVTILAGFIAYKFSKFNFHIFPVRESYNLEQYNTSMKRCFLILSGMLVGTCVIVLIVVNLVIKSRFINHYLSKVGTYVYSAFAVLVNGLVFMGVIYTYFVIVNKIGTKLNKLLTTGVITENVNINTIELFKYAVVVFCVIFLVINSFNIVSIIKEKNRFVFEEEV
jgi:hypothetical protein